MSTAVHVPNRHQIMQSMRAASPAMRVFYPGDEFLQTEYCGIIRWLTPDLGGDTLPHPATGEMVVCDGETDIHSRIGKERTKAGVRDVLAEPAEEIVAFLTSSDGFGRLGVVALLSDDEAEIERVKEEARKRYRAQRRIQAEAEWQGRLDFIKRWQDNPRNRNRTPPPPNVRQQKAIDYLMAIGEGADGTRFISPDGTYQTDDWKKFKRYMKQMHGQDVRREDYGGEEKGGRGSDERAAAWSGQIAKQEQETEGVVSVSGTDEESALEGHAEAVGSRGTTPKPPVRRKKGRGRSRASNRRAAH